MTTASPKEREDTVSGAVQIEGSTVYLLNNHHRRSNRWTAHVYPGFDDYDRRISQEECEAVARKMATVDELLAAAVKHLAALDEEAAANMALDNAEANFSYPMAERRRAGIAMVAASVAEKELRAAIAKATGASQ